VWRFLCDTFSRFSRTPTCNRQTHEYGIYRASMASRGKKIKCPEDGRQQKTPVQHHREQPHDRRRLEKPRSRSHRPLCGWCDLFTVSNSSLFLLHVVGFAFSSFTLSLSVEAQDEPSRQIFRSTAITRAHTVKPTAGPNHKVAAAQWICHVYCRPPFYYRATLC